MDAAPGPEACLVASDALLREAMEYLARLPVNPMTAQLVRKIRGHLENPRTAIAIHRAASDARIAEQTELQRAHGMEGVGWFHPSGLPALQLQVLGAHAKITSPAAAQLGKASAGKAFTHDLSARLGQGVDVDLQPTAPRAR